MASFKHEILKSALNALSLPMYWKLPPIDHLRSILETSTMLSTLPWGISFEEVSVGGLAAECLSPAAPQPHKVIMYLHGGGYVIGSPHTHRNLAGRIAKGTNLKCLIIDYRKAPEHPFPAALDDAYFSWLYLVEKQGYNPSDIVLVGDSAGGGLCIALQLRLRDKGMKLPRAVVLLSPYLDLTTTGRSIQRNAKNDRFLDVFEMRRWARLYAGAHDLNNPFISPLFGDLSGLSPVLVQASCSEVLYNDSTRFVRKARGAGVEVKFQTWKGLIHWWHMFNAMPESKEAVAKIIQFIGVQLDRQTASRKTA
jgi:acetyl esterase/lipase